MHTGVNQAELKEGFTRFEGDGTTTIMFKEGKRLGVLQSFDDGRPALMHFVGQRIRETDSGYNKRFYLEE